MLSSSGRSAARLPPGGQDPLAIAKTGSGDGQACLWRSPNLVLAIAKSRFGDRQTQLWRSPRPDLAIAKTRFVPHTPISSMQGSGRDLRCGDESWELVPICFATVLNAGIR